MTPQTRRFRQTNGDVIRAVLDPMSHEVYWGVEDRTNGHVKEVMVTESLRFEEYVHSLEEITSS